MSEENNLPISKISCFAFNVFIITVVLKNRKLTEIAFGISNTTKSNGYFHDNSLFVSKDARTSC